MGEAGVETSTVVPERVEALLTRVRREVDDGLLPSCQIAVALDDRVVVDETFGAPAETRFVPFSCSKVLTAATMWRLLGDGLVDESLPVAHYLPEFLENGKEAVTVEQVMLHTSGFPMAPLGPKHWGTSAGRRESFRRWRLNFDPGTVFMYHPVSAHWVLVEIIESLVGEPYADAIQHLVTDPLGLPRLLGIPHDQQHGIAPIVAVGEALSEQELAEYGMPPAIIDPELAMQALLTMSDADAQAVGVPGGGAVTRAADFALLYQALLHNPGGLWDPEVLADGTGHVRNRLPDFGGVPACRSLGLVIAGDDGNAPLRGFGKETSARAFGHNGAGGQIAWADPESGLSMMYVTNGLDRNLVREARRNTAIASLAALVTTPA